MTIIICKKCKRERLLCGNGLCQSCYNYNIIKNNPKAKARQKRSHEKWLKNNEVKNCQYMIKFWKKKLKSLENKE